MERPSLWWRRDGAGMHAAAAEQGNEDDEEAEEDEEIGQETLEGAPKRTGNRAVGVRQPAEVMSALISR